MTNLRRYILLSGALLCASQVAACSTAAPVDRDSVAAITAKMNVPYYVNASHVSVESKYNAMGNREDISMTLPMPLDTAVKNYALNRFHAAGVDGVLHVVIEEASVFMAHEESPSAIASWVGAGSRDRYTAVVKLRLFRESSSIGPGAMGTALRAERSVAMPADISLDERDERLREFTTELLADLDKAATESIAGPLQMSAPARDKDIAPSPGPYPPVPVDRSMIQ